MAAADGRHRRPAQRAILLVNEMLRGHPIDRTKAREITGLRGAGAHRLLMTVLDTLDGAHAAPGARGTQVRLRGVRRVEPSADMAIAAALGASLARFFAGTRFETAMREAVEYLGAASTPAVRSGNLERKLLFLPRGGEAALPASARSLEDLVQGILEQRAIRIRYRRFSGVALTERLEPLSLVLYDHQLYVLCRAGDRSVQTRRFSRILDVRVLSERFEYPSAQEYDPDVLLRSSFGIIRADGPIEHVAVRLAPRWAPYVSSHRWHRSQRVEPHPHGPRIHLDVRVCEELEAWILGFGEEAEVIAPESLRSRIAQRVATLAGISSALAGVLGPPRARERRGRGRSRRRGRGARRR